MSGRPDRFTWHEGDITITPPPGQENLLKRLRMVMTVGQLEQILPEVEMWMRSNPDDLVMTKALNDATDRL